MDLVKLIQDLDAALKDVEAKGKAAADAQSKHESAQADLAKSREAALVLKAQLDEAFGAVVDAPGVRVR